MVLDPFVKASEHRDRNNCGLTLVLSAVSFLRCVFKDSTALSSSVISPPFLLTEKALKPQTVQPIYTNTGVTWEFTNLLCENRFPMI